MFCQRHLQEACQLTCTLSLYLPAYMDPHICTCDLRLLSTLLPPSPAHEHSSNMYITLFVCRLCNAFSINQVCKLFLFTFLIFLSASVQSSQSAWPFVTVQGTLAVQKKLRTIDETGAYHNVVIAFGL